MMECFPILRMTFYSLLLLLCKYIVVDIEPLDLVLLGVVYLLVLPILQETYSLPARVASQI